MGKANKSEEVKGYVIAAPFRDKFTKRYYEAGDEAPFEGARLAELIERGLVKEIAE